MELTSRVATMADVPVLERLVNAAIGELQKGFLDERQIPASRLIMGLDLQLIADGTYFVVECGDVVAGCGGWSRRKALFGAGHAGGRDLSLLDPARDAARVRAMYTDPAFARRGVARLILWRCVAAARAEGFQRLELVATMAGRPLYEAFGFSAIEEMVEWPAGVAVPVTRMGMGMEMVVAA
ncbi:MAG: GNAT family N-acetyltransferase [Dehalococcoidia bacterium]|nr:GNAT family N-acetyltransferase [Dehalococcoidia bacterium]